MRNRVALAFTLALCIVGCSGQSRDEMLQQAAALTAEGNRQGALVIYKSMLKDHPEDQEALVKVVQVEIELGKFAQAAEDIAQLADSHPAKPSLQAKLLIGQNRLTDARAWLEKQLAAQKTNAELWELMGVCLGMQGHLEESLAAFRTSLKIDPQSEQAGLGEVSVLNALQQGDLARRQLEALLRVHPKSSHGLHQLATFQLQDDKREDALQTYVKIIALNRLDVDARYQEALLRLLGQGDTAHARAVSAALAKEFSNLPEPHKLNGLADIRDGNYASAVTSLQQAVKIRNQLDSHYYLGMAFQGMGNLEQALSHYYLVLGGDPDNQRVRQLVASTYLQQGRVDQALAEIERLLASNPASKPGKLLQGEALLARKDFDKSLDIFTELANSHSNEPRLHLKRGLLLAGKGELAAAEAAFRLAVAAAPQDLEPRVMLMPLLMRQDRLDDAASLLEDPALTGRNAAMAKNALAKIRLRQGKADQAEALLAEARQLEPGLTMSSINLAALRMRMGQVDQACAELETGLASAPNDVDLLMRAASCAQNQGREGAARKHLERAMELGAPQGFSATAGLLAKNGDLHGAVTLLDKHLATHPENKALLTQKAQILVAAKDKTKALDTLTRLETLDQERGVMERIRTLIAFNDFQTAEREAERLISFSPASARHYFPLAFVKESQKDAAGTEAVLRRALAAEPGNPDTLMSLGKLLHAQGRSSEALAVFDQIISTQPAPAMALAAKGAVLQAAGKQAEATELYERALQFSGDLGVALNNLAMIYAENKDTLPKAEQLAVSAFKAEGNNPAVLDTLGFILLQKGRLEEAIKLLSKALELYPNNQILLTRLESAQKASAAHVP